MHNYKSEYKKHIADYLGVNNIYLFWKARVGLYTILKAMGVEAGDEVILPAYTCVVVPNAVIYLGAKPIYVDIDKSTFNSTAKNIKAAVTSKTKVIICQNTYGLSSYLHEIQELAKANGVSTIEDCTHGFGGSFEGLANGLMCDAAIYSSQWNKPFSTGVGGFATIRNTQLSDQVERLSQDLVNPSLMEVMQLRALVYARQCLMNDSTYWPLLKLYRWLSKNNIVVGSSTGEEINSIKMPKEYYKGHSDFQAKIGIKAISQINQNIKNRKLSGLRYSEFLKEFNKNHVSLDLMENHAFLKYPLLVKDRDEFMRRAEKNKIALGDWFTSPLHPVKANLDDWHYNEADFPNSVFSAQHVVNLPTTNIDLKRVINFLSQNINLIMSS